MLAMVAQMRRPGPRGNRLMLSLGLAKLSPVVRRGRQFARAPFEPDRFVDQLGRRGEVFLADGDVEAISGFNVEANGAGREGDGVWLGLHGIGFVDRENAATRREFPGIATDR
jgi:hypothetical protein